MSGNFAPLQANGTLGFFRYDTVSAPVAGSHWVFTAGAGALRCVLSVRYLLAAGATAADRYFGVTVKNQGSTVTMARYSAIAVTAGSVILALFDLNGPDVTTQDQGARTQQFNSLPPIWLLPGDTLQSDVQNLQALDNLSQIQIGSMCYSYV